MSSFLLVGRVAKAHGVKGELSLDFNAESLALIEESVFLGPAFRSGANDVPPPGQLTAYTVSGLRMHHHRPLLLLQGVTDRNMADALRGCSVYVPRERLPETDEGEIYLNELPGLTVSVLEDGAEVPLGCLASVDDVAGQEIWTIFTEDGREVLFPANRQFVHTIDLQSRRAVIMPPPGLLDLYLG